MPKKRATSGTPDKGKGMEETIAVAETPTTPVSPTAGYEEDDGGIETRKRNILNVLLNTEDSAQQEEHESYMCELYRTALWQEIRGEVPRMEPVNDSHSAEHRRGLAMDAVNMLKDIIRDGQVGSKFRGGRVFETCKRIREVLEGFECDVGDTRDFSLGPMQATYLPRETVSMIERSHRQLTSEWERKIKTASVNYRIRETLLAEPGKPIRVRNPSRLTWSQAEYYIKVIRFMERGDRIQSENMISYLLEIFDETWRDNPSLGLNELLRYTLWWVPESIYDVLHKPKDRFKLMERITKKGALWKALWDMEGWASKDHDMFPSWDILITMMRDTRLADRPENPEMASKRGKEGSSSDGDGNKFGGHRTEKEGKPSQEKHKSSNSDKTKVHEQPKAIGDENFVKFANRLHTGQCVGCGAGDHPLKECKGADPEAGMFLRLRQVYPSKYRERLNRLLPLTDEERANKRSAKSDIEKSGRDQAERSNKERGMAETMNFVASGRGSEVKTVLQKRLLIYPQKVTSEKKGVPVETLFDRCTFVAKRPLKEGERLDETNTQHGAISADLARQLGLTLIPYEIDGEGTHGMRRGRVSNWVGEQADAFVEAWTKSTMAAVIQESDTTVLREFQDDLDVVKGMRSGGAQVKSPIVHIHKGRSRYHTLCTNTYVVRSAVNLHAS